MQEEQIGSYDHVLKYTGLFGGIQSLNILMGLVRNKLVALILGPAGMGLVSLFNAAVGFISQATNLGIPFSAVRHVSEIFEQGDEQRLERFVCVVRTWSLITALFGMLICVALGPLLSDFCFSWGDHTLHFVLLAPAVALMAISGGEAALLKGARRLKSLAMVSVFSVFLALVVSVPVYWAFGQKGIVPVIVLLALGQALLTLRYSFRLFPYRISFSSEVLGRGAGMVRLGVAFVVAGIMGSGAEMLIRSYLNNASDLDTVGLYNAGYMLIVTLAGTVFTAMETDFFPRLSAVNHDVALTNQTVNRQIEVSVLIVSPLLVALIISLPILIPLLYSGRFSPVVAMAQVAVFSMFLKSVVLPIEYITLAKGDSLAYMVLEGIYDILLVVLIVWGYKNWGLWGTGLGLSLSYLLDLAMAYSYVYVRYGFRLTAQAACYFLVQLLFGGAAYALALTQCCLVYWIVGALLVVLSLAYSIYVLRKKSKLWTSLTSRLRKRFKK